MKGMPAVLAEVFLESLPAPTVQGKYVKPIKPKFFERTSRTLWAKIFLRMSTV
jgi:hypothetical protein